MQTALPAFQYPTRLICIDDDTLLLRTLESFISPGRTKLFSNPQEALDFFKTYQSPLSQIKFLSGDKTNELYDCLFHAPVDFDITSIAALRHHPERLDDVAVIVTDFSMPQLNGVELCRQLQDLPIKKILLTGEAEPKQAVEAFNEHIIHTFLRKDSASIVSSLKKFIKTLTREYFIQRTKNILGHLEVDSPIALSDPVFINFFDEWCEKNNIQEFYLVDKQGSFLAMDANQKEYYFILHTEESLNLFYKLNEDEEGALSYLAETQAFRKIPFFGIGKEGWNIELSDWGQYFYSPQIIEGRQKYYWAVAEAHSALETPEK